MACSLRTYSIPLRSLSDAPVGPYVPRLAAVLLPASPPNPRCRHLLISLNESSQDVIEWCRTHSSTHMYNTKLPISHHDITLPQTATCFVAQPSVQCVTVIQKPETLGEALVSWRVS